MFMQQSSCSSSPQPAKVCGTQSWQWRVVQRSVLQWRLVVSTLSSRAMDVYHGPILSLTIPGTPFICCAVFAGDSAHARAIVAAVPRTSNAIFWVAQSSLEYRRCVAAHPSKAGDEYTAALDETHQRCADRLLKLCQVCLTVCRATVFQGATHNQSAPS